MYRDERGRFAARGGDDPFWLSCLGMMMIVVTSVVAYIIM